MQNNNNPYCELISKNSNFITKGFIYAKKYDLGEYPGVKLDLNKKHITKGELYNIHSNFEHVISELDYYEGFNELNYTESLFVRKEVVVQTDNENYKAWVYEYNKKAPK